jgi:hypothetical protein
MAETVIADDPLELVTLEDEYTVGLDDQGRVRISPTDVSQFIRLDQCERYLRLRLLGAELYVHGGLPRCNRARSRAAARDAVKTRYVVQRTIDTNRCNESESPAH